MKRFLQCQLNMARSATLSLNAITMQSHQEQVKRIGLQFSKTHKHITFMGELSYQEKTSEKTPPLYSRIQIGINY